MPSEVLKKIKSLIGSDLELVDSLIDKLTYSDVILIPKIAMHVISAGGKRLRPTLTLLSSQLCGYKAQEHLKLAAAVEFIHTATLLHDDVVDKSDLRRGSKTANNLWGNSASILVGDFLLSRAFQLMVNVGTLEILQILSDTSAIISEGEVRQMAAARNIETSEEEYLAIISAKTAQLFAAACQIGGIIAEKDKAISKALFDYGMNLGIAFQIMDDVLDYSAKQEKLGKEIGDDLREGKSTLPLIYAYRKASREEKSFLKTCVESEAPVERSALDKTIEIINKHSTLDSSITEARKYAENGKIALSIFPDSPHKSALIELIDFSVSREY